MVFSGQDVWRKHPMLTGCFKRPFPGLGIAVGIFASYYMLEKTYKYITGKFYLYSINIEIKE